MQSLGKIGSNILDGRIRKSTIADLGQSFKVKEFTTKTFHGDEEIGIGNVSKIEPFIDMKNEGINTRVSCVIFRTQEIVSICLQEIEFKTK